MARIITHGGCADGFFSAYIFKKHILPRLAPEFANSVVSIIGLSPRDVQTSQFTFEKDDFVLDLPCPIGTDVLFWADHHETSGAVNKKNHFWKKTPSCTGYLIDLFDEFGIPKSEEVLSFKKAIDIMDDANYTIDDVKNCYYSLDDYSWENLSVLQKVHAISAIIRTRDYELNGAIVEEIFSQKLAETPMSDKNILGLNPIMYFKARLTNFNTWRKWLDTFVQYDERLKLVIQDDRLAQRFPIGVLDRFYIFVKYPDSLFGLHIDPADRDFVRVGISCNIFRKDEVTLNIGKLCSTLGKEYGVGAGGGHQLVGSATVRKDNLSKVIDLIKIQIFQNGLKS